VSLNPSAREATSIRKIFVKRSSQFSFSIIGAIAIFMMVLQVVVLWKSHSDTTRQTTTWLEKNQRRIEQALFLQNTLGTQGILSEHEVLDAGIESVEVFSEKGDLVTASGRGEAICSQLDRDGFRSRPLRARLCYSGPLKFADRHFGRIVITA